MAPPATKKRSFPIKTTLALVLLGVGVLIFFLRPDEPLEVETLSVERGAVREIVSSAAAGEVKPSRRVTVRSEIAGTVEACTKKAGDRVTAGELLVRFSADDLDARAAQAKANLEAAKVTVRIAETRRTTAERAHQRAKKLHDRQAISSVDLERAETEARAASHAVDQAKAALMQARAAVKITKVAMERATVEAPFAGVLQEVFAEVGVQVAPTAPLFDLIDDAEIRIEVPVDEADIARVRIDQSVSLRTSSKRNESLVGKVTFIPVAVGKSRETTKLDTSSIGQKDRAFYVHVVPEEPQHFHIGASVNAEFLVSARQDVLFVPTHVVLGRGTSRSVYVIDKRNRVEKKLFEAGLTSWSRTEVISGLELGTEVIASLNVEGLEEGVRVRKKGKSPESAQARTGN